MKYKFTGEEKIVSGVTLRRIQAVKSFGSVKEGDVGGWIEKELNLSHDGDCWVSDEAQVFDSAQVSGGARVSDEAWVSGGARVLGESRVSDRALVLGKAVVSGGARVSDEAWVSGGALVSGGAQLSGGAQVSGETHVCEGEHTGHVLSITLPQYTITCLGDKLRIGCQKKTVEEWKRVTLEEAVEMGLRAENYELFMHIIRSPWPTKKGS